MILVTSGAYVGGTLEAEFGRIPPAFLPVRNQRLFVYQAELFPSDEELYLSIPATFTIPEPDRKLLESLGYQVVPVPVGLSLGESILYAINFIGKYSQGVKILHGDTIIHDIDYAVGDALSVSPVHDQLQWARIRGGQADNWTYSGYFAFSDIPLLVRLLVANGNRFIHAVEDYREAGGCDLLEFGDWLDFGHSTTYHRSKAQRTTERSFNAISVRDRIVTKRSDDQQKIRAESGWYEHLPPELRNFVPAYLGRLDDDDGPRGYRIEQLPSVALSDLYVFGDLSWFVWERIFGACNEFIEACARFPAPAGAREPSSRIFLDKTRARLERLAAQMSLPLDQEWRLNGTRCPSLSQMAERSAEWIPEARPEDLCVVHGDFCLSNILYDCRLQSIKVIDPRGMDASGTPSIYGDRRYDVAKLAHSVLGLYDFIVADYYELSVGPDNHLELEIYEGESIAALQALFSELNPGGAALSRNALSGMLVQLFLSMIPLHDESPKRQMAFLANACRLFLQV